MILQNIVSHTAYFWAVCDFSGTLVEKVFYYIFSNWQQKYMYILY